MSVNKSSLMVRCMVVLLLIFLLVGTFNEMTCFLNN